MYMVRQEEEEKVVEREREKKSEGEREGVGRRGRRRTRTLPRSSKAHGEHRVQAYGHMGMASSLARALALASLPSFLLPLSPALPAIVSTSHFIILPVFPRVSIRYLTSRPIAVEVSKENPLFIRIIKHFFSSYP